MRLIPAVSLAFAVATSSLVPTLAYPSGVAAAKPGAPTPWLKGLVERGKKLAERKVEAGTDAEKKWRGEVKAMIDDLLDWDELTKQTLGQYWEQQSPKEKTEFGALLREMIEASYESKLKLAAKGEVKKPAKIDIKWLGESVTGDRATASAKVSADKTNAQVEFRLRWDGSRWRVYDLSIDDVSTVRTYRSQFGKIIAKDGFSALLDRMRKKTTEIRSGLAEL